MVELFVLTAIFGLLLAGFIIERSASMDYQRKMAELEAQKLQRDIERRERGD
jgi:hypothetical protein